MVGRTRSAPLARFRSFELHTAIMSQTRPPAAGEFQDKQRTNPLAWTSTRSLRSTGVSAPSLQTGLSHQGRGTSPTALRRHDRGPSQLPPRGEITQPRGPCCLHVVGSPPVGRTHAYPSPTAAVWTTSECTNSCRSAIPSGPPASSSTYQEPTPSPYRTPSPIGRANHRSAQPQVSSEIRLQTLPPNTVRPPYRESPLREQIRLAGRHHQNRRRQPSRHVIQRFPDTDSVLGVRGDVAHEHDVRVA